MAKKKTIQDFVPTNYTIHFGKQQFKVDKRLYDYFNSVKDDTRKYNDLYKIVTGIKQVEIKTKQKLFAYMIKVITDKKISENLKPRRIYDWIQRYYK